MKCPACGNEEVELTEVSFDGQFEDYKCRLCSTEFVLDLEDGTTEVIGG